MAVGWRAIAIVAMAAVGGCTIIPADGPSGAQVEDRSNVHVFDSGYVAYALVKLSPLVVAATQQPAVRPGFSRLARAGRYRDVRIGIADQLSITVFEAGSGGLFIPNQAGSRPGNFVQLPTQQVDQSGNVTVPYAGTVPAAGRTPIELQRTIEDRLRNRAIEPQVAVHLTERRSSAVSVLGEVTSPTRFAMDPGGIRLLEAIARAGGARHPAFETIVTLQRGRLVEQVPLTSVVTQPAENIYLEPGDTLILSREQKVFLAFGATPPPGSVGGQNNRRFLFETENLKLAEAMAKAGGLQSDQANPSAVFLYRLESREVLANLGVDLRGHRGELVPTIYRVDLREPDGYFLANAFYMRDGDLIYVSDAPSVDLAKFMGLITTLSLPARDIGAASNAIRNLR